MVKTLKIFHNLHRDSLDGKSAQGKSFEISNREIISMKISFVHKLGRVEKRETLIECFTEMGI